MKKVNLIEIEYRELDSLVQEKLGFKDYEFVPTELANNGSRYKFYVTGELDKWDEKILEEWGNGGSPDYSSGVLFNKLCADGHIEAGEYLVEVFW